MSDWQALLTGDVWGKASDLMRARSEQRRLVDDVTIPIRWIAILVFGFLAQIYSR